jgi:hypothetical protein
MNVYHVDRCWGVYHITSDTSPATLPLAESHSELKIFANILVFRMTERLVYLHTVRRMVFAPLLLETIDTAHHTRSADTTIRPPLFSTLVLHL